MRHDPKILLDRHGHFTTIAGCSCGWTPRPDSGDTDDQFSLHAAIAIAGDQFSGLPLDERINLFVRWCTCRLIYAAEYRDQYGEASFSASGQQAEAETIAAAVNFLTGREEDLDRRPPALRVVAWEGVITLPLEYDDKDPPRRQLRVVVKGARPGHPRVWACPKSGCAIFDSRCKNHPEADCVEVGRSEEMR